MPPARIAPRPGSPAAMIAAVSAARKPATAAQAGVPPHPDFPIPCARFVALLAGTHDEVWATLLKLDHGKEVHKPDEWLAVLENLKTRKV